MSLPENWSIGEAADQWLAELTERRDDGGEIKPQSLVQIRSRLRKLACCEADGAKIAAIDVCALRPDHVLAWFAHVAEHRGEKVAWNALVQFRQLLVFVRRRGVAVVEINYIKRPAAMPVPPSQQRGPRRTKQPAPRLAGLPRLSMSSPLRLVAQHLIADTQRRLEVEEVREATLASYRYFAAKLEEPAGHDEDGTPGPALASLTLEELEEEHVEDWYYTLVDKVSRSTAAAMVKRLRFLLHFAEKRRRVKLEWDPTEALRKRRRRPYRRDV